jgi:uncharacterized membrane protein YbhN (UPF0104 family)
MLILAIIIGFIAFCILVGQFDKYLLRKTSFHGANKIIRGLVEGLAILTNPSTSTAIAVLTVIAWSIVAGAFAGYLSGLHDLPWIVGLAIVVITNISSIVTMSPGNIGVYEAVGSTVLILYGLPFEQALVTITGLHIAAMIGHLLFGAICRIYLLLITS